MITSCNTNGGGGGGEGVGGEQGTQQGILQRVFWPRQSPDLHIKEAAWEHVKIHKTLKQPESTEEQVLQDAWKKKSPYEVFEKKKKKA